MSILRRSQMTIPSKFGSIRTRYLPIGKTLYRIRLRTRRLTAIQWVNIRSRWSATWPWLALTNLLEASRVSGAACMIRAKMAVATASRLTAGGTPWTRTTWPRLTSKPCSQTHTICPPSRRLQTSTSASRPSISMIWQIQLKLALIVPSKSSKPPRSSLGPNQAGLRCTDSKKVTRPPASSITPTAPTRRSGSTRSRLSTLR